MDTAAGFAYAFDCGDGYSAFGASSSAICPTDDNGTRSVGGKVRDKDGAVTEYTASVEVANVAPTIGTVSGPVDPVDIGAQSFSVEVTFSDPGASDTHDVTWDWGDESSDTQTDVASPASAGHTYAEAGVYVVTVTVADDDGGADSVALAEYVVIYDPEGGFVTGGGWIMSPPGAYAPRPGPDRQGQLWLRLQVQKGRQTVPTGKTEFQFKAGDLQLPLDQLRLAGGGRAGQGQVQGRGHDQRRGQLWLHAHRHRRRASQRRHRSASRSGTRTRRASSTTTRWARTTMRYDGTVLGGGNIKVHKK